MQETAIFHGYFQMKKLDIFLIFAKDKTEMYILENPKFTI